ncbi:nicotinamide riboside transporter PnuC [Flammeovirgaceae bacterium SG7u.111]|nr:nicotinamide riboside transporter PnuC [Flammeovirgaceae bacterium SG7u.132]WPO33440.1 nicotinamide riboside transporter PnuC [Flammeovirgaceae bacterium SG7u.111]
MDRSLVIEIISVVFGLAYLVLMMRENIWCWIFGILSSILGIYLFVEAKLYSEAILYFYYVLIGVYGWVKWSKKKNGNTLGVTTWGAKAHALILVVGFALSFLLGYTFNRFSDAEKPFIDSTTSIFSFIASYLEAHKILSSWIFWIVINGISIWLYFVRGLEVYAGLMVLYFILSFAGYFQWKRSYEASV